MSEAAEPKREKPEGWGDINSVLGAPLENVTGDASWISVICMWLTLPISCIQGIIGGLCQAFMAFFVLGCYCCQCIPQWLCCSGMGSAECGRPCILAPAWWRYVIGGLVALIANSKSRLALFIWEWKAFGEGDHYWHGEGYWAVKYQECSEITKSEQKRASAFGCIQACVPDLFATNILLFLSNDGPDSEWAHMRSALHCTLLDRGASWYIERSKKLRSLVAAEWPNPQLTDLSDTPRVRLMVAKCVFYMMFGVWLPNEDAEIMRGWRDNALYFVLPRLVHRFLFNFGIRKVKSLRANSVAVIEKHGLESFIVDINEKLPERYKRTPVVKLCDEMMFAVGFAGIGGTSACCETVGAFLQRKIPEEASAHLINFEKFPTIESMVEAFKNDPLSYIKEACRIDPPVTSATSVSKETRVVTLKGRKYTMPENTFHNYTLSMANRDPTVFANPDVFDPSRTELNMALTWNGAFGTPDDEKVYPRICPGRYLSLDVALALVGHVVGLDEGYSLP
ncbi:unnamed protein product [Durusdinium trenchii]|uniref:Cytochrome P450 n=2 Tax=Durusdinium trenchii TaxID=1381693 RepID=A0ABP0NPN3_9DINO